ncbi:MAG: hypothetical protein JXO22_07555 [Phycisphaerae bacterium]|nr:hypothetical protein [Phycisphaerae bacterium]
MTKSKTTTAVGEASSNARALRRLLNAVLSILGVIILVALTRSGELDSRPRMVAILVTVVGVLLGILGTLNIGLSWRPWLRCLAIGVMAGVLATIVAIMFALRAQTPSDLVPDSEQLKTLHRDFARQSVTQTHLAVAVAYVLASLVLMPNAGHQPAPTAGEAPQPPPDEPPNT